MKTTESFLLTVLGWGYLDAEKLESLLEDAEAYGYDAEDIKDNLSEYEGSVTDINAWIYETLNCTARGFLQEAREYLEEKYPRVQAFYDLDERIEDFEDNLSPFVNYLDSFHNNILDEYNLQNKEESFKAFIKYLIKG